MSDDPTVRDEIADEVEAESNGHQPGGSALDRLRARRVELQKDRTTILDIPGWQGMLVGQFRPVPWDDLKKIAKRAEKMSNNPRVELIAQTDTILAATDMLMVREDGELTPMHELDEVDYPEPIRFDAKLAEILELGEVKSARNALWRVFNNDLAVTAFHNELMEWQRNADEEVDEEMLGEAKGTD